MMAPYPKIEVAGDTLVRFLVAFRAIVSEFSESHCGERGCGCESSRKIAFARAVEREIDALVQGAEARQAVERLLETLAREE